MKEELLLRNNNNNDPATRRRFSRKAFFLPSSTTTGPSSSFSSSSSSSSSDEDYKLGTIVSGKLGGGLDLEIALQQPLLKRPRSSDDSVCVVDCFVPLHNPSSSGSNNNNIPTDTDFQLLLPEKTKDVHPASLVRRRESVLLTTSCPSLSGYLAAASSSSHSEGTIRDYEFLKLIQQGGVGAVYLSRHKTTGQKYAIKVLKKTTEKVTALARKEAATMQKLKNGSKHIVQLREVIESDINIFLVMQWGIGGDLFAYVENRKKVDEEDVWRIFGQVVDAVAFAHAQGIIHRDIKPENIFLDKDGNALLGDWGHGGYWTPGKKKRKFWGTVHYSAPEMLRGQSYIGPEIDVFALGVLLYILLTGRAPFGDAKNSGTLKRILTCNWIKECNIDPSVEELLSRVFKVDPQERATLGDVQKYLDQRRVRKEGTLEELEAALLVEAKRFGY